MTQEEKQLLLKDLCARLAFGRVKCQVKVESFNEEMGEHIELLDDEITFVEPGIYNAYLYEEGTDVDISDIKPYLRPMSSMAEGEWKEFSFFIGKTERYVQQVCLDADSMVNPVVGGYQCVYWGLFDKCIDWLNKNMFDYRGLIPMGLALEAKEGMYK